MLSYRHAGKRISLHISWLHRLRQVPRAGGCKQRKHILHRFWRLKSKAKVSAGSVSPEASLLGAQMATLQLRPQWPLPPPPHTQPLGVSTFSYRHAPHIGLGPHLSLHCDLITSLKTWPLMIDTF